MAKFEPKNVERKWLLDVHSEEHLNLIESNRSKQHIFLDADTYMNDQSHKAALLAAGSLIKAVDCVMKDGFDNAFCAVRPPGHHAERNRPMGFCLFNNAAVGAVYARAAYGLDRICILDWDVHHGNGTQDIFYEDPDVLYVSTHQDPLYPGTGNASETGSGNAVGSNLNFPLPPRTSQDEFIALFEGRIASEILKFKPDLIIVSAGFDAHQDDPLSDMCMSSTGFAKLTRIVKDVAATVCSSRLISTLEGGYNLTALAESVHLHLSELLND